LRDQLYRHSTLPDFCGFVARDAHSGAVLGLVYGYTNAPGQWWRDRVAEAAGMQRAWNILHDSYCLTELGVVPAGRRQGIAHSLVRELMAHQPHPRLLLSTRSDNHEGLAFYHATGWQTALPKMSFGFGYPPYDILERWMRDVQ
jgi:ribosomal protein S18 acetylase RimI-like enzyme